MKDAGRIKNFGDKANTNGFRQNPQNINKKGAPKKVNFRAEFERILNQDATMWKDVKWQGTAAEWKELSSKIELKTRTKEDRFEIGFETTSIERFILEFEKIAISGNERNRLSALTWLMKHFGMNDKIELEVQKPTIFHLGQPIPDWQNYEPLEEWKEQMLLETNKE